MLEILKGMIDEPVPAPLLKSLLETAEDTILDYIGRDELPPRLQSVVIQYAVYCLIRWAQKAKQAAHRAEYRRRSLMICHRLCSDG